MSLELTNLLPEERVRSLRQLYFVRLLTVGVLLLAVVMLVHGVLLLPSYLYLGQQVKERQAVLASLSATLEGSEEREVSARVAALTSNAIYLARLAETPAASTAIAHILDLSRPGIRLTGFTFSPAKGAVPASMGIAGVADSRESLRRYEQSLKNESYIDSTNLPISAYAKERDIDFVITVTGSLKP